MSYATELVKKLESHLRDPSASQISKVHELRVTVKRLRSLWRLARSFVPKKICLQFDRELRGTARAFSDVRDEVIIARLLAKVGSPSRKPKSFATPPVAPRSFASALRSLKRSAAELEGVHFPRKALRAELERSVKVALKKREECDHKHAAPESFHTWRKRTKNLMYQMEFAKQRGIQTNKRDHRALKQLTDHLGKVQDYQMLYRYLLQNHAHPHLVERAIRRRNSEEKKSLRKPLQIEF